MSHQSIDQGAIADAVLSREPLKANLWSNFKTLLAMGEGYQLAGGEGAGSWRNGPDPHTQLLEALADLHASSDGDESSVQWDDELDQDQDLSDVADDDGPSPKEERENNEEERIRSGRNLPRELLYTTPQKPGSRVKTSGAGDIVGNTAEAPRLEQPTSIFGRGEMAQGANVKQEGDLDDGTGPSRLHGNLQEDDIVLGGTPEGALRPSGPGLENNQSPPSSSAAGGRRRLSSSGLKQVDIRNFFGSQGGGDGRDGVRRKL